MLARTTSLAVLLGLALLAAGAPAAGAARISVAVLGGETDTGPSRVMVVAERRPGGRLRVTALRADREPGGARQALHLMRGGCEGRRAGTLEIPNGRVVSRVFERIGGPWPWLHVLSLNNKDVYGGVGGYFRSCARLGRPASAGWYTALTKNEALKELVAVQRRGERWRVTSLLAARQHDDGVHVPYVLGASTRRCSEPMSAASDLLWRTPIAAGRPSIKVLEDWDVPSTRSLAVLPRGGTAAALPAACAGLKRDDLEQAAD